MQADTETRQAIAQTIIAQLGGKKFEAMTGAKHFVALEKGLTFRLPRAAKGGINLVEIVLTPADEYDVVFYKARGLKCEVVAEVRNILAENIAPEFEEATGLRVSL